MESVLMDRKCLLANTVAASHMILKVGTNTPPDYEYFKEAFRVSKNQIIWGANYMTQHLPASMGWVFWDKGQRICNSDGELAFTSFKKALRVITINRVELLLDGSIHPTQKPVKLYRWLLKNYAKPGDKILDTHAGSFSIGIACHDMGFDLDAYEIDKDYYAAAMDRFKKHTDPAYALQRFKEESEKAGQLTIL